MNKKKKNKSKSLLALLLICVIAVAVISAYFTATDTATNTFTVGKVSIDLQEPSWNGEVPTTPNKTVPKDPQILNDGNQDAYVYLTVEVPYANVVTANADGTKNAQADTELFTYTVKDGWIEVGTAEKEETKGVYRHVYAYAADESTLSVLRPDETTSTLFDSVTFANVVETPDDDGTLKDLLESTDLDVVINAYGIETEIIGGEATPEYVWEIITNQVINPSKPVLVEGDGSTYNLFAVNDLRFRSTAAYSEFQELKVNGETVDPKYYTTSEGSTVINLSGEYLATLEEGVNDIAVVSDSGAATGTFSGYSGIPEGCTYTVKATGEVLTAGDSLPDAPAVGDIYTTSDYEFHYWEVFDGSYNGVSWTYNWKDYDLLDETEKQNVGEGPWYFAVKDKTKESYGAIPTTIFGERVKNMFAVFGVCSNLKYSPLIPSGVENLLSCYVGCASLTSVIIPESVTNISGAFYACTNLTSVIIPESITSIGDNAFAGCKGLTSIAIPDSVTSIGQSTFEACTGLTSITIPDNVTSIDYYAFGDCLNLKTINYTGTEEEWNAITFGSDWNYNCPEDMVINYNYVAE